MIGSMTGYGQAENSVDEITRIKVEMRSVNHRYLDISIRMPREIQTLEERIRRRVQQKLGRGRVDIFISWHDETDAAVNVTVDRPLVRAYQRALQEVSELYAIKESASLQLLAGFPDVLRVEKPQVDLDEVWERLAFVLDQALNNLIEQRQAEGARLLEDFKLRLTKVAQAAELVETRTPLIIEEHRSKLEERLNEVLGQADYDPARVLTEVAIFADRSNVTEELVRLTSHLTAFQATLKETGAIGRKLDFLTQELFRETNTIGSKANDYEVAKLVVEMKTEIEKIREQVQNIE
ncbi:MAG TPA: YicC/YloC family endoribonuclease [Oscillospiraceae bacterium]|nr:YicC/YloC family endoribonuclease [Oscillospiraceae bacterium]